MYKKRILLLEPKVHVSKVLESLLKDEGYQCKTRTTTHNLPDLLAEFQPNAILIARQIPPMGVISAIEYIRQSPYGRHAAVIYMTGSGQSIAEATSAGANITLAKPLDLTKFLFTLENFTNLN